MSFNQHNFEITIKFNRSRYKATCSAFPTCSGFGKTVDEAMNKLAASIAGVVGTITEEVIRSILSSDRYTTILTGLVNEKKERRVFPLHSLTDQLSKDALSRLRQFIGAEAQESADEEDDEYGEFVDSGLKEVSLGLPTRSPEQLIKLINGKNVEKSLSQEGFVFGFPLSFN